MVMVVFWVSFWFVLGFVHLKVISCCPERGREVRRGGK